MCLRCLILPKKLVFYSSVSMSVCIFFICSYQSCTPSFFGFKNTFFPPPVIKSQGLDFEVAGDTAEVQKEQKNMPDWTLRRRGYGRSPKRQRKWCGLDVAAVKMQAEVQIERENVSDWMSKLRGSRQRSKLNEKTCQIGHQSNRRASESPK